MKFIVQTTLIFIIFVYILFLILFGIDKTVARNDYNKIKENNIKNEQIKGCIIKYNCDFYNNLLKEIQQ